MGAKFPKPKDVQETSRDGPLRGVLEEDDRHLGARVVDARCRERRLTASREERGSQLSAPPESSVWLTSLTR
jgi:hypothetical protein